MEKLKNLYSLQMSSDGYIIYPYKDILGLYKAKNLKGRYERAYTGHLSTVYSVSVIEGLYTSERGRVCSSAHRRALGLIGPTALSLPTELLKRSHIN